MAKCFYGTHPADITILGEPDIWADEITDAIARVAIVGILAPRQADQLRAEYLTWKENSTRD